jgi:hypothetical protein
MRKNSPSRTWKLIRSSATSPRSSTTIWLKLDARIVNVVRRPNDDIELHGELRIAGIAAAAPGRAPRPAMWMVEPLGEGPEIETLAFS